MCCKENDKTKKIKSINVISQNCRGLGNNQKRRDVLHYFRCKDYQIICLQDIHVKDKLIPYVKAEWGLEAHFSSYNGNSRGVAILFNKNFEFKVNKVIKDHIGNYIILDVSVEGVKITLVNIYGPNQDDPKFFEKVQEKINKLDNDSIIICGDWNLVLDPKIDTENYRNINNPKARQFVLNMKDDLELIDIWRTRNEKAKGFTWRQITYKKQARLDFFLISNNLLPYITNAEIIPGYRSDHSGILLGLNFTLEKRGKGFWKFNSSLLKDKTYVELVKNTIKEVLQLYELNLENAANPKYSINDQLLLETLLLMIRGETIKFSSNKKKKNGIQEKKLEAEINNMEKIITQNIQICSEEYLSELENKKKYLQSLRVEKIEGVMIRSKSRYYDLGEKPTNYFFNLEKRNFVSKTISVLKDKDGCSHTGIKAILTLQTNFYKSLYSKSDINNDIVLTDLIGENAYKLSNEQATTIEGEITMGELQEALKNLKNNKSPGSDGYTAEFFKVFWNDLGKYVLNSINSSYREGILPLTLRQGIITCIPKADKDRRVLKNWRPISLLNITYKLATTCIANRIKIFLNLIIHKDQTGFIPGRFIGENIRLIYDILWETEQKQIPGLLLLVDFEKAFDTVEWNFISKTLEYFNFGPSVKKWINLFYTEPQSCVIQNGHISEFFQLERGCRQGDPISPYIFIMCAEILGNLIRSSSKIKGISINNNEYKLSQYADDTQIFLNGSEESLRETLHILHIFYKMSGLKINIEKTKVVWIGSQINSDSKFCEGSNLDWTKESVKILGVNFNNSVRNIWDHNKNEILHKINNILKHWGRRKPTLYGKVIIIKSLAISKFVHLFISLPNPPKELIKELQSLFFKFMWNRGPDRIKRTYLYKNVRQGGLSFLELDTFIDSLKITWLRRLFKFKYSWLDMCNFDIDKLYLFGGDYTQQIIKRIKNPFWIDLLSAWYRFTKAINIGGNVESILYSPLWFNSKLCRAVTCNYVSWVEKGIHNVIDLFDTNGDLFTFDDIKLKFHVKGNFLEYNRLVQNIPKVWIEYIKVQKDDLSQLKTNLRLNENMYHLLMYKKGCKNIYNNLLNSNNSAVIKNLRWEEDLGDIPTEVWKKAYQSLNNISSIKIRDFQFKILHRILPTKSYLKIIRREDNDVCNFCNKERETIFHLLFECQVVQSFWKSFKNWLLNNLDLEFELNEMDIILGLPQPTNIVSHLLLQAKYFIFKTKFFGKKLIIKMFVKELETNYKIEKYNAMINNKYETFKKKWLNANNYFEN